MRAAPTGVLARIGQQKIKILIRIKILTQIIARVERILTSCAKKRC